MTDSKTSVLFCCSLGPDQPVVGQSHLSQGFHIFYGAAVIFQLILLQKTFQHVPFHFDQGLKFFTFQWLKYR